MTLFQFFKKKSKVDPVLEEQAEQTEVGREEDVASIRQCLERDYPDAICAIEDYRKGYLTDQQLDIRFSKEEVEMIHRERDERDIDDREMPTAGSLL